MVSVCIKSTADLCSQKQIKQKHQHLLIQMLDTVGFTVKERKGKKRYHIHVTHPRQTLCGKERCLTIKRMNF